MSQLATPSRGSSHKGPPKCETASVKADSSLVLMRDIGERKPLFLIHGVDGGVASLSTLVGRLQIGRPIYGIRSQALLRGRPLMRIEEQAAFYTGQICRVQPEGPYHLLGFSFGGLVALEVAQQLHAQGRECGLLGAVDNLRMGHQAAAAMPVSPAPGNGSSAGARPKNAVAEHLGKVMRPGGLAYAWSKLSTRGMRITYTFLDRMGQPIPGIIKRPYDVNWFAAVRYVPRAYPGRVTLFQSTTSVQDGRSSSDLWAQLAGQGAEIREIPGTHESLLMEPNVTVLAAEIEASLAGFD